MMRISGILTTKGLAPRKTNSGSRSVNSTNDSRKINQDRIVFGLEGSRKADADCLQRVLTLKSFFMPLARHEKGEQKTLQTGGTYAYVQLTAFRKIRKNFQSALDRSAKPCYFTKNGLETPDSQAAVVPSNGTTPDFFMQAFYLGLRGCLRTGETCDSCFNPASPLFCRRTAEKNNSNLIIGRQNDVFNRTTSDDRRRTESPAFRPAWSFNLYVTSGGIARHEASPEPETEYGGSPAAPADRINRNTDPRTEHRQNLIPKRRLPSLTEFCSKTTPCNSLKSKKEK